MYGGRTWSPRQVSRPVARLCPQGWIHVQWLDLIHCAGYVYHSQICAPFSDSCIVGRLGPRAAFMYDSTICSPGKDPYTYLVWSHGWDLCSLKCTYFMTFNTAPLTCQCNIHKLFIVQQTWECSLHVWMVAVPTKTNFRWRWWGLWWRHWPWRSWLSDDWLRRWLWN